MLYIRASMLFVHGVGRKQASRGSNSVTSQGTRGPVQAEKMASCRMAKCLVMNSNTFLLSERWAKESSSQEPQTSLVLGPLSAGPPSVAHLWPISGVSK